MAKEQRGQGQIPSHHHLSLFLLYVPAFCLTHFFPSSKEARPCIFFVYVLNYNNQRWTLDLKRRHFKIFSQNEAQMLHPN